MKKLWWYGYGKSLTRQMEAFVDLQFAHHIGDRLRAAMKSVAVLKSRKL
jgi:hypothetical protein